MGELKIIKASAGSGKTHALTSEYLRLLYTKERAYKNILAVTFTNKATEEMKRRVVETLFRESATDLRARERLVEILHDYSSFAISTIDRFFQQTMRAFAREIGKNSAYSVELDYKMVINEAIDNMVMSLDKPESEELLEWLTILSIDSIDRGDGWNFKKEIKRLSNEIFNESYRLKKDLLKEVGANKGSLTLYKDMLKRVIKEFKDELERIGKAALEIVELHSLELEDFIGGSRTPLKNFLKAAKREVSILPDSFLNLVDTPQNWASGEVIKKDPALYNVIENAYNEGLNALAGELIAHYDGYVLYNSAEIILENIYTLGILIDIESYIQEYTKENNVVLIPETTELLNRIIDGSDSPFIYEKIGSRIDHFMLDEFQDTSIMQWQNFKPLILNSLACGYDNLIVGDVKQSIYRWRGSDWNLLNSDLYKDLDPSQFSDTTLLENWRSCKNIIDFNNTFFPYLAEVCRELLDEGDPNETTLSPQRVYSQVKQTISAKSRDSQGHILLKFVKEERDGPGFREQSLDKVAVILERYIELGYRLKDITFLVRKKDEAREVVEFLIERGYPVISDEALYISSSASVRRIITILKYINSPDDAVNNVIAKHYGVDISCADQIAHLPLYELCEELIGIINSEGLLCGEDSDSLSESLFMHSFLDMVLDYSKSSKADISSFIQWWEESGVQKSIPAPDGQNALRVMTIHKSKGLGIPVVIIPFFNIKLDYEGNLTPILWCETEIEPFNAIPLLPVKYKKGVADTIFSKDYLSERRRVYIDNLNLAYVAFTRAERELAIISKVPPGKGENSVSAILYKQFCGELDENLELNIGEWSEAVNIVENLGNDYPVPPMLTLPIGDRLKLSLRGEEFFSEKSSRVHGMVMHEIMESVVEEADLEMSVNSAVSRGVLAADQRGYTIDILTKMMEQVRDRHWFDGTFKVYNELEILEPGGNISRPDRVLLGAEAFVIDFKFGKKRESSHIKQVQKYMDLMRRMGKVYVKGYIWYPQDGEIIELI
jgi:ATP-dependent exoDNAse (exonuclease V) beta subunit